MSPGLLFLGSSLYLSGKRVMVCPRVICISPLFQVILLNEGCKRSAEVPTLFYMPHCEV